MIHPQDDWTQRYNCAHRDRDGLVCRVCADAEIERLKGELEKIRVAPCPACVSEHGRSDPQCPYCKGSGRCPSSGQQRAEASLATADASLKALVEHWREKAAQVDGFHATMAIGWKVCANELSQLLDPPVVQEDEKSTS